jgi:dolichol-phosphate mannosyltransferase
MTQDLDLSVIIPALREGPNLAKLLPELRKVLDSLGIGYEILIVTKEADDETIAVATAADAKVIEQREPGYGGALLTGFADAAGTYLLTMDADLSHRPTFVRTLWDSRLTAELVVASRYVAGGKAEMPASRYLMSRVLNLFFRYGLSLPVHDLSSGFRLYKASLVRGQAFRAKDFDILQQILLHAYAEGWRIAEVPFAYAPREHGRSNARVLRFGVAYLRTFWPLWKRRNSILAADYDYRAHDSRIFLQRYWQRSRFRIVTELIKGEGPVLDIGCGSSRIIGALPPGSVAMDILRRKLRFARGMGTPLVQASAFNLPFRDESFPCVLCSEVIEHVPKESPILDEMSRVLAPGGRLVLGTPDYARMEWVALEKAYGRVAPGGYADEHISHYTRQELVDRFKARGFRAEAARYIARGEMILAFRKGR